ncbi:hypothetical protein LINPERHAP1_LOCUS23324 [Linum perenne]
MMRGRGRLLVSLDSNFKLSMLMSLGNSTD